MIFDVSIDSVNSGEDDRWVKRWCDQWGGASDGAISGEQQGAYQAREGLSV